MVFQANTLGRHDSSTELQDPVLEPGVLTSEEGSRTGGPWCHQWWFVLVSWVTGNGG